jgi:hypothetical protein
LSVHRSLFQACFAAQECSTFGVILSASENEPAKNVNALSTSSGALFASATARRMLRKQKAWRLTPGFKSCLKKTS